MKQKLITFFTLITLCDFCVFGQTSQNVTVADVPKISVVGVGTVTVFPNAAQITIALKFVKPTLREAINDNQKTASEVLTIVKKFVIDTTGIKVSLISTDKSMRYDNTLKKEVFVGFESTQKIIFTLKDLSAMQDFTEQVLKTKIYEIEKVAYFHTDAANYIKQAQEIAVTDAIETTQRLAKASAIKLGKIIYLQTNASPANAINNTVNSYNFQTFNKGMGGQGVSSSGQLINFTVNVTMFTQID
ncbi:MAG: SIMPL domain-containing protein [Cytophagales bacterium]